MKFLTLVALFCVVALSNLANAASCIDTNPSQGSQSILGCSCYSGFTGDDCSVDSVGSCDLPSVAPLTTESIATMGSLNINNKNLLFSLRSPGKSSRYFSVSLNDNQECAYPASAGFTRTFDSNTCEDVFDAQFLVDDIINTCGSIVDAVEGAIEISGTVDITAFDQLDSFRGVSISRSTHSAVSYVITVPTVVNASVDGLSIISAMDVMAAVTFQDYNQTDDTFIIQLVTSVQFPYILNEESFGSSSTSFSVSISRTDDGSQCDDASGPCTQEFEIIVSLDGACEADGDYSFSFFGDCRGQGECPGAGETSASFTIDSDNVCSSVELTAKVSADLESFGDDSFSTPQSAYLPNAQLYFTATVDADVTVSSVSVQEIRVVQNGDPQVIVSGGTQVDPAVSFNANGDGNTVNFIFVAVSSVEGFSIFDANVDDAIFSFDVEVDLEIVYDVTFRKRAVQTKTFTVSRHLVLSPETAVLSPKSSLDNSASAASFTAGSLVAAAVVGVAALF